MKKNIIVVFMLLQTIFTFAQSTNVSLYSFYGIGESNRAVTAEQFSMGGINAAVSSKYHINMFNPAANTSLFLTTYAISGEMKNLSVKEGDVKQSTSASYLSYITVGIPLNKGAFTFGLMPNTSVGYSLTSPVYDTDGETISEISLYEGSGGSNKVFLGVGYEIYKGLSIGLQGNYIFGNVENSIINQLNGSSRASKYESNASISSFAFNTGINYKTKINNNLDLTVGANIEFENEIDLKGDEYLYSVSYSSYESPRDTILNAEGNGVIKNPLKTSLGVGIGKENKWYAEVDYSSQKPIELSGDFYNSYSKVNYTDYSKISIGAFFIPKYNSITSYWQRVTYRAGLRIENTGLMVNPTGVGSNFSEINDFGISFGVGLPVSKQLSNLNVGFEFGKRGKTSKGLIQENYFNVKLGISLNDRWFKKQEIY
ncbi:hypothetical protein R3X25_10015 [Lutibacter sp. TH_r2]|uniref:hypothetical protein n=1 Tax=Lutibacter sp. TH_r2 TaxID=3082083 RepID=UPI002955DBA5|nr:hypothetical protein [Lutibacter sp. TH_r2]MDV7187616.1 hypothetical protein [Lutibacter sp. TH_r2]